MMMMLISILEQLIHIYVSMVCRRIHHNRKSSHTHFCQLGSFVILWETGTNMKRDSKNNKWEVFCSPDPQDICKLFEDRST